MTWIGSYSIFFFFLRPRPKISDDNAFRIFASLATPKGQGSCHSGLPGEHVGIMSSRESFLEFLQLKAGEGSPISALLPLRCKVIDLGLALRAGRRCSRVVTLFLGSHFLRRDSHLSGLGCRCGGWRRYRLLVSLLARLLQALIHLTRATRAARRTCLRDSLLTDAAAPSTPSSTPSSSSSSCRMICDQKVGLTLHADYPVCVSD